MAHQPPDDDNRSERVLAQKLSLLFRGSFTIPVNFAIGCIATTLLWQHYPQPVLLSWLAATLAVCAARLWLQHCFLRSSENERCNTCWSRRYALGALASGLLWGALAVGLAFWGTPHEYVLVTLVSAGMTAGALASISPHFPAYAAYAVAAVLPLCVVSLLNSDRYIEGNGAMMLVYLAAVLVTGRYSNRSIERTFALQVDNEILQCSLQTTRKERDAAQIDKWSTLAQLSHELRTPLNAILGFSEAMRDEFFGPIGDGRYKEYANDVHISGRHLLTLTEELLELSQGEAGELAINDTTMDLAVTIRACCDMLALDAQNGKLTLASELAPDLPLLRADKAKVRRLLLNLLDNAIKFTPRGGRVWVTASCLPGREIEICVHDTGIGMTQADIPRALQPFGRLSSPLHRSAGGVGLGLPIARRLAEAHGATFTVTSEREKGTACRICFPASRSLFDASVAA